MRSEPDYAYPVQKANTVGQEGEYASDSGSKPRKRVKVSDINRFSTGKRVVMEMDDTVKAESVEDAESYAQEKDTVFNALDRRKVQEAHCESNVNIDISQDQGDQHDDKEVGKENERISPDEAGTGASGHGQDISQHVQQLGKKLHSQPNLDQPDNIPEPEWNFDYAVFTADVLWWSNLHGKGQIQQRGSQRLLTVRWHDIIPNYGALVVSTMVEYQLDHDQKFLNFWVKQGSQCVL